jgi:hypothetical protein
VKNWSGHIYFNDDFQWKEIEKAFPEIWELVVSETKQNAEDIQYDQISLELNLAEIRKNQKPIGYIKEGVRFRLVFPSDTLEMIVYRGVLSEEIRDLTESISKILKNKKIKHRVDYDKMILYEIRKRRK